MQGSENVDAGRRGFLRTSGGTSKPGTHFERMYHLDLLKLAADKRRLAADMILETIGLDATTAAEFLRTAAGRACAARLTTFAKRPSWANRRDLRRPDRISPGDEVVEVGVYGQISEKSCAVEKLLAAISSRRQQRG